MRKFWFVGSVLFGVGLLIFSLALANAANRSVRTLEKESVAEVTAPTLQLIPDCSSGPDIQFSVLGFNWDVAEGIVLQWDGVNQLLLQPNTHSGSFSGSLMNYGVGAWPCARPVEGDHKGTPLQPHLSSKSRFPYTWTFTGVADGQHEVRAFSTGAGSEYDEVVQNYNVPYSAAADTPPSGTDIIISRQADEGILSTSSQSIFGPNICVDYGDPFSPWNSPWQPGPYTYTYRIKIPTSYVYNVVRVELFDPDSMNRPENTHVITRTSNAVSASLLLTTTKQCGNDGGWPSRQNPCYLRTDEVDGSGTPVGGLALEQVNPYWFVRVDENRGAGSPPGNGQCGSPANYDARFNTATLFQLYYFRQTAPDVTERVNLAAYTGQTGDGVRDAGDHNTDLRWVSPGADAGVPVDPGSAATFEVDLTQDTLDIVTDTTTGDRYLYLGVTGLSGASDNNFEIWAGPPIYTATVPSDVNARNVYLLNNPGAHDSAGVKVYALDYLPQDSKWATPLEIPLVDLTAADAGTVFRISLYDSDAGSQPPVTFFIDTIQESDWSMTFGATGVDDPDGVPAGVRCQPGSCSTQWVDPAYNLVLPNSLTGGRLMARYIGGFSDSYSWQVRRVVGMTAVTLSGVDVGMAGTPYTFTAAIAPLTAAQPITYEWRIDGQPVITQTGSVTSSAAANWPASGWYTVQVTATNEVGVATGTHMVTILSPKALLPVILKEP